MQLPLLLRIHILDTVRGCSNVLYTISNLKAWGHSRETCILSRVLCYFARKSICICTASLLSTMAKIVKNYFVPMWFYVLEHVTKVS